MPIYINNQKLSLHVKLFLTPSLKSFCHPKPRNVALTNIQFIVKASYELAMVVPAFCV